MSPPCLLFLLRPDCGAIFRRFFAGLCYPSSRRLHRRDRLRRALTMFGSKRRFSLLHQFIPQTFKRKRWIRFTFLTAFP